MMNEQGGFLKIVLEQYDRLSEEPKYLYVVKAVQFLKEVIQSHRYSSCGNLIAQSYLQESNFCELQRRQGCHCSSIPNSNSLLPVNLHIPQTMHHSLGLPITDLQAIYFVQPDPFGEVDQFISRVCTDLQFKLINVAKNGFAESLQQLKKQYPINYVIMGTRNTDPYCQNLQPLAKTDVSKGYPEMTRVNPILNWSYGLVWDFIRQFRLPFCKLYLKGYTYLGNKKNTKPNQVLLIDQQSQTYRPAWQANQSQELLSRK